MRAFETRIPPPVLTALVALGMWLAFQYDPNDHTPWHLRTVASSVTLLSSAVLAAGAFFAFWRAGTTVNPFQPERASSLVTRGVFRVTRNPMYLALCLLLLAYAIELWSPAAFAGPAAFAIIITRLQIMPEERALETRFGAAFSEYKCKVRRWI